jgi:hypothetical protein
MTPQAISDITPDGTATPVLAPSGDGVRAYHIQFTASSGSTSCRVGGEGVNATSGARLPAGQPVIWRCNYEDGGWDLSQVYVYASGSESISISYSA